MSIADEKSDKSEILSLKMSSADEKSKNLLSEMGGNGADTKSRDFCQKWVLLMKNARFSFLKLKWMSDECWSIVDWSYTSDGEWDSVDDVVVLDISDDNNGSFV